jgi:hypothetical protein
MPDTTAPTLDAAREAEAQRLLDAYEAETRNYTYGTKPTQFASGRALYAADPRTQVYVTLAILSKERRSFYSSPLEPVLASFFARKLPWDAVTLRTLLNHIQTDYYWGSYWSHALRCVAGYLEAGNALNFELNAALREMQKKLLAISNTDARKLSARIGDLLGEDKATQPDSGETWADLALSDLAAMPTEQQNAWRRLLAQAQASDGAKPSTAWRREAKTRVEAVGEASFRKCITRWFAEVAPPPIRTHRHEYPGGTYESHASEGSDRNISLLKGLAWMCADRDETALARALAKLIEVSVKKIPGTGPWAVRAATGAVWALTEMRCPEAVSQLGRLKTKITLRTVLNLVDKGLEIAAQRAGMTRADLEDRSVPTCGFGSDGIRRESFGECAAVATITPTGEVQVAWFGANGKPVKSVPAEVKKNHAAGLKEFKADVDLAGKLITAQKNRFDSFYLPERVWTLKDWRDCFAGHPVIQPVASRLIWHFAEGEQSAQGIWSAEQNAFVDENDAPITWLSDATTVRLWHPIGFAVEDVLQWRNYLQKHAITQPFKQAYREIYLLTDAERNTMTYSNRFAGHILKQHQMNALAALRGWKNKLRLMVDDTYPPATRELAFAGLRAEFWIEGAGDEYGTDTTDTGTYLYLTTDQVRFYPMGAEENLAHASGGGYTRNWMSDEPVPALPLTEIPALIFSEVMRDVDLFVGVCSVGNDPTWQDGGPQGRYQSYWSEYSFGDLSATAQTRRVVLEKLLPRLKIAARCTLSDKFLIVRGDLRTYKIHLGSGNILMEPNDQYLCIVQDRSQKEVPVQFLPFEGDPRLALILSKAFLLADDTRITDPTITRQIKR